MKRLFSFVPVLLFAGIALGVGFNTLSYPKKLSASLVDERTPRFQLPSVGSGEAGLSTSDLKGKVSLLNVFASWCESCKIEQPILMHLAREAEIPVYGIDWKDQPGNGARWLNHNKNPYRLVGDDRTGRVGNDLGVAGLPETFVLDQSGRIRYRHVGPLTPKVWREVFEPMISQMTVRQ